jgi:hypothetical protein
MELSNIILKSLIQNSNPLSRLLSFHFLLRLDLLEHLNNEQWIKKAFFDVFSNVTF